MQDSHSLTHTGMAVSPTSPRTPGPFRVDIDFARLRARNWVLSQGHPQCIRWTSKSDQRTRSWVIHQENPENIGGILKLLKKTVTVFVIYIPQIIRLAGQVPTQVIHFPVVEGSFSFLYCFHSLNRVNPPSCPDWVFPRHFRS